MIGSLWLLAGAPALAQVVDTAGSCPGSAGIRVIDLTNGGRYAILSGAPTTRNGGEAVPAGPCAGTNTTLSGLALRRLDTASDAGEVLLGVTLPAAVCDAWIQVLDLTTCAITPAVPLDPDVKRVFLTPPVAADMTLIDPRGGLLGADAICNARATSARLGGTWVAWLSTDTVSARSRIGTDGPWHNLVGHLVATDRNDLLDGGLRNPIRYDDRLASGGWAWSATDRQGMGLPENCDNWTRTDFDGDGHIGDSLMTNSWWTDLFPATCSDPYAGLYCFEP